MNDAHVSAGELQPFWFAVMEAAMLSPRDTRYSWS